MCISDYPVEKTSFPNLHSSLLRATTQVNCKWLIILAILKMLSILAVQMYGLRTWMLFKSHLSKRIQNHDKLQFPLTDLKLFWLLLFSCFDSVAFIGAHFVLHYPAFTVFSSFIYAKLHLPCSNYLAVLPQYIKVFWSTLSLRRDRTF